MRIAHLDISPPVALAPMEGVTDRAFRGVIRALGGCGLTVTEFVSSEGLTREVSDAWRMAELDPDEHPVSIQIYGRDPERMAASARYCQGLGADFVDLNLGCPSKRVTSGCAGSALMREPDRARDIFQAVAEAVTIPMTVKMRLGWDLDAINAPRIAANAVECGAAMIAVHARSRACGYKGEARWELVRPVRDAIDVPLLVNGDIVDGRTARAAMAASGADGVMVGRAVMSNPWAIAAIAAELAGNEVPRPTSDDRRRLLHAYLDRVEADGESGHRAIARLRRIVGYLSKGMPGASRLRASLHTVRSVVEARALLDAYFAFGAEPASAE